MKCCERSQTNKEVGHHQTAVHDCGGGLKHSFMMILCCLAPLGATLLLKQSGYDGAANYLVLLLCPLMHLFMMRRMRHKQD